MQKKDSLDILLDEFTVLPSKLSAVGYPMLISEDGGNVLFDTGMPFCGVSYPCGKVFTVNDEEVIPVNMPFFGAFPAEGEARSELFAQFFSQNPEHAFDHIVGIEFIQNVSGRLKMVRYLSCRGQAFLSPPLMGLHY